MNYIKEYSDYRIPVFTNEDIHNVAEILLELDTYGIYYQMAAIGKSNGRTHDVISKGSSIDVQYDKYSEFKFTIGQFSIRDDKYDNLSEIGDDINDIIERIFNYLMNYGSEESDGFGYLISLAVKKRNNQSQSNCGLVYLLQRLRRINGQYIHIRDLKKLLSDDWFGTIMEITIEID